MGTSSRKHLSATGLLNQVRNAFEKIPDHRSELATISLVDSLMSGLAVFGLKFKSLLSFDRSRDDDLIRHNLKSLYGVDCAPSDTQMREILDEVNPKHIRPAFNKILSAIQRGNILKEYLYLDGHYLVSVDGTGQLSSEKVHCDKCCKKRSRNGTITYYHQLVGAAVVHPDKKTVIPLAPEPILKQDGETKNDCERNASKRLLEDFRREHPHLKVIIIEDSLASNGPHINLLKSLNMSFILGVKPGDHKALFNKVNNLDQCGKINHFELQDGEVTHKFRYINNIPLNKSHPELFVNFIEYWQIEPKRTLHFSWVTDVVLSDNNLMAVKTGGRARWKIENETFNTLKNQGYNLEHNYGHGKKNLANVFLMLTMLAFLIDQTQEMACALFQKARKKLGAKIHLWERIRSLFINFLIDNWEDVFNVLATGPPCPHKLIP